jgi:hypothetical protein
MKMTTYKIALVKRYLGKWTVGIKENENADARWLAQTFNTKKEALAKFKCIYAPIGTKEIAKVKTLTEYEVYEAR